MYLFINCLKAAYDYYPFGMLMPSRMYEDSTVSCVPVSRTRYVVEVVKNTALSSGGALSVTGSAVALNGTGMQSQNSGSLTLARGKGQEMGAALEVGLPLGGLGVDVVGVSLVLEAMGKGEIDGELRWYPAGWDQRSGPVEADNYQVLSRGLVRDQGVLKFSVGDEDEPMEDGWKDGGLVAVVRGMEQGVDKLGVQNVSYSTVIRAVQTYVTLSCDTDGVWKGGYAYGFNGQRKDDEINGIGNHVDFGARGLDTRLGRWWSVDPLAEKYPSSSPYVFANNSPIILVDRDGREWRNAYDAQVANLQSLPNTRSVQRQLMAALDNQSKVNAILNELKKNDGALYNYIDNLKVSSKSGNEMPFKVFVGLGGRASANSELESSGIAGITEYIPSRIEGTYNGKPIRVPLTKEQDRFQVGARVTLYTDNVSAPLDVTLAK